MRRKVLKVGNASLAISLPSKWVKEQGLRPGNEIEAMEKEGGLLLTPHSHESRGEVSIHIARAEGFARRLVYPYYIQGYDVIQITYEDPKIIPLIEEAAQVMLGFDVVSITATQVTLKNIAKGLEDEFENYFTRLFHIARTMAQSILEILQSGEVSRLQEVLALEIMSNKIHLFCKRAINTQPKMALRHATATYALVTALEECCDVYRDLAKVLMTKKKADPHIQKILQLIVQLHDAHALAYNKPSVKTLIDVRTKVKSLKQEILDNAAGTSATAALFLYSAADLLDNSTIDIRMPSP